MTPSLNCSHSSPQVSGRRGRGGGREGGREGEGEGERLREGKEVVVVVVVELFQFYRVNRDNRRLEMNVHTCIPFSSSFFFYWDCVLLFRDTVVL